MKGFFVLLAVVAFVSATDPPKCREPVGDEGALHFPNPDDCTTFYVCISSNVPVLLKCRPGTWFNPTAGVCDWPQNVEPGVCVAP